MNESEQKLPSNFESKDIAFEYLIQESQNQVLKNRLRMELDRLPDVPLQKRGAVRNLIYKNIVAMVAGILVIMGSFYWYTSKENSLNEMVDKMILETKFVLESDAQIRGVNDEEKDELIRALRNEINRTLENEDYEAAQSLYLTKENKNQLSIDDKFYFSLSLARVKNGDYHKAIRMLDDIVRQRDKYYSEALWLQALLYLKINEPDKSKLIFKELKNNSPYQKNNIKVLLEKMAN